MSIILNNSVYLSVPKTGTKWAEFCFEKDRHLENKTFSSDSFFKTGTKHIPLYTFDDDLKPIRIYPELENLKAFGFVRHPLTWYQSLWGQICEQRRKRGVKSIRSRTVEPNNRSRKYNALNVRQMFNECLVPALTSESDNEKAFLIFIENVIKYSKKYDLQSGYWGTLNLLFVEGCSEIGRFESLYEELCRILTKLEDKFDEHVYGDNKRKKLGESRSRRFRYTEELAKQVLSLEKPFIERFDYDYILDKWIM